jgi:formylmethanofuran dehydrogenase subunit C
VSGWRLTLKQATPLRLDLRSISPATLALMSADAVARLTVWHGTEGIALGELFGIAPHDADGELLLEGDLSKADRIGWQLAAGRIRVEGNAGDYLGCGMSGGEIVARGNAGLLAACEMSGGRLEVAGNVGDHAASALPGNMDGMRGGVLLVRGSAGARFGDRMRRGSALVTGDAGDFLASRMVAGSIVVAGRIGAHCAHGMRRGTVIAAGPAPTLGPTFANNGASIGVFWQLLGRDLAQHGGAFATLAQKRPQRWVGDIGAGGKGEVLVLSN